MSRVTPVTEFITFPVKDVEKAVGSENWIRDIAKCVGCTGGNWGWQIEDGGNLHWALSIIILSPFPFSQWQQKRRS